MFYKIDLQNKRNNPLKMSILSNSYPILKEKNIMHIIIIIEFKRKVDVTLNKLCDVSIEDGVSMMVALIYVFPLFSFIFFAQHVLHLRIFLSMTGEKMRKVSFLLFKTTTTVNTSLIVCRSMLSV